MHEFMETLEQLLKRFEMSKDERLDILVDYQQMYEEAISKGFSDEEVIEKLGTPQSIFKALKSEYEVKTKIKRGDKIIGITPFLATIIFFALGFGAGLWHPGWMAFLIIPMTAIVVEMFGKGQPYAVTALSPFIAIVGFFILGFMGFWHPAWVIFLIIPVSGMVESRGKDINRHELFGGLLLFGTLAAFVLIGYFTKIYIPWWLVLLIPVGYYIVFEEKFENRHANHYKKMSWLVLIALGVSVGLYLYLGYLVTTWFIATSAFLIVIITGVLTGHISFHVDGPHAMVFKIVTIGSLLAFLGIGWFYNAWAVSWLFFLSIPILGVILMEKKHRLTALSPFVSVIVFFLLGYFLNLWHIAWLVFLLIPIMGVLEE